MDNKEKELREKWVVVSRERFEIETKYQDYLNLDREDNMLFWDEEYNKKGGKILEELEKKIREEVEIRKEILEIIKSRMIN